MGLGEIRENRIELIGERLDDLRVEWSPARLRNQLSTCPFSLGRFAQALA